MSSAVVINKLVPYRAILPSRFGDSTRCFFRTISRATSVTVASTANRFLVARIRATFIATETKPDSILGEEETRARGSILACPICYEQLAWNGDSGLSLDKICGSSLQCGTCKKTYTGRETHFDLTTSGGATEYGETQPPSTEIFRTPLVSFLYERGWRQSFVMGGFPGPEKEFELAKDYLKPVFGGNIVDASCGSGLFSRRLAKSGLFSLVVALDFSENMLKECYQFIQQEENFPAENITLVRADIARLPFVSRSIDAVHAGAALHCWPSPSSAVAEISRVLRPGGVFVASTYILDGPFRVVPYLRTLRENIMRASGSRIFLSESELEGLCTTCGLVDFTCVRNGLFVMLSARKPRQNL